MVHLPASLILLLSISTVFGLPTSPQHRALGRRDINISHISKSNGTATTHTIDSAALDPALKAAIEGSDLNINIIGDRKRSVEPRDAGIRNSTINLTVISKRAKRDEAVRPARGARVPPAQRTKVRAVRTGSNSTTTVPTNSTAPSTAAPVAAQPQSPNSTTLPADAPTHHNILIDASNAGNGTGGGITNSTININLNQARRDRRRKLQLGDHSILVDTEHVEDSTVHVNILPVRALDKSVGKHSILIDSSSGNESGTTSAGDHSGVVDTSSGSSSDNSSSTGIRSSTINMTVVAPKVSATDDNDEEELSAPKLIRRSESSPAWAAAIKHRSFDTSTEESSAIPPPPSAIVEPISEESTSVEELVRQEVRRSHASRPSRFSRKA